jgi:hypothetical protein
MTITQKMELWELIQTMPTATSYQKARKTRALWYYDRLDINSGAAGCIRELANGKSDYSKQIAVAKKGKPDCFVYIGSSRYKAEYKTNGGRIGSLFEKNAPQFVVYEMDICNAGTSNKRRQISPVVLRTETFIAILEECNAIKSTNGSHPEPAIQSTSLKLFEALEGLTAYDANYHYNDEDII